MLATRPPDAFRPVPRQVGVHFRTISRVVNVNSITSSYKTLFPTMMPPGGSLGKRWPRPRLRVLGGGNC